MKTFFQIIILCFSINVFVFAQIPNSGFEDWTNGNPNGWTTDNDPAQGFVFINPTTDSHSGSYALKGEVLADQGYTINPVLGIIFPYSQRPTNFTGYFKFTSVNSDSLRIIVSLGNSQDSAGAGGGGSLVIKNTVNDYTEFNIPIYWVSKDAPDTCVISFTIYPDQFKSHAGTTYYIDDLSLSNNTTNIGAGTSRNPRTFSLSQNYPNPFNPTTRISYSIPLNKLSHAVSNSQNVTLKVFNILGKEIATLVNKDQSPGNYEVQFNGDNLPSGVYLYRLTYGTFVQSKSMVLLK